MQNQEKIIEKKICKHCNSSFEITDKDLEFYEKVSPNFNSKKYLFPTPNLCPDCSAQRKLAWRNDKKFYRINIGGKKFISMYRENTDWNIIDSKSWWSQNYKIPELDFDFNKSFFEQFGELLKTTPHPHIITLNSENSDYTNFNGYCKNSYLCAAGNYSENIYYCYNAERCVNCIDSLFIFDCENCSNLIHSSKCYNVHFSKHSENCSNSYFLENCNGCSNCYYCIGLKNKKYCIFNVEYSKEEYEKKLEEIKINGVQDLEKGAKTFEEFSKKFPKIENHNFNSQNVEGEYIINSKNCDNCYIMDSGGDNCKNIINGFSKLTDAQNCCYCGENASLFYECMGSGDNCYNDLFCTLVLSNSNNCIYCDYCISCEHCFGCSGLHNKKYCILNKQYSREEYEILVPKIIEHMMKTGEWGEFFPASFSPFGYNETVAQEYFPLSRRDVFEKHLYKNGKQMFNWSDYEPPFPKVDKIIKASMLPNNISDIPDDILNWAIECEVSGKPFRIIASELEFYRKLELPIPKRHPGQRYLDRLALRNPRKLYDRICEKCGKNIKTTYIPEKKEIVYYKECYEKEIY